MYSDKLAARSQKVAFYMLHKLGGGKLVQPGDRVALVFRPDEATQFVIAFYGCIFAAVIPVAIEPPITKEVRLGCKGRRLLRGPIVTSKGNSAKYCQRGANKELLLLLFLLFCSRDCHNK